MRLPSATPWSGDARRTRVKICCIASEDEATISLAAGADLLGLVSAMPSGPGPIAETRISEIVRFIDRRAATVLLTSRQDGEGIAAQLGRMSPAVLQLVDDVGLDVYAELRDRYPAVVLMQVLHVRGAGSVRDAVGLAVPGMPAGSPGMEMPGSGSGRYDVIAFGAPGGPTVFASHA